MEKLFLDTNLLLDLVLDRKPFSDDIDKLLELKSTHKKRLYTSVLSLANVAYVVRKAKKDPFLSIKDLLEWVEAVPLTIKEFDLSVKSAFKDFEDALQYFSAQSVKADVIITRDVKDFANSSIPVKTPMQFRTATNR